MHWNTYVHVQQACYPELTFAVGLQSHLLLGLLQAQLCVRAAFAS